MAVQRKVFRIEQMNPVATPATLFATGTASELPQQEILTELRALRDLIERRTGGRAEFDPAQIAASGLRQLKEDTDSIHRAISHTRQELAMLRVGAFDSDGRAHVTRELDAVADGAERATQQILDTAEDIEEEANTLAACLKCEQERALAQDIQDQAIRIFEACNFQDLSGQRITKVIATLKFVEERIAHMIQIWGGMEASKDLTAAAIAERNDAVALHGPKLEGNPGHATQEDIDALFSSD